MTDPLDALMAQHGADPAAAPDPLDALMAQHGAGPAAPHDQPDFRTTNAPGLVDDVGAAWNWANRPLIPQIADAAHAIAAHLDKPALDRSRTVAQILGFVAGATGAAGDVAASFTSPIGLALTLAGVGPEGRLARNLPALKGILELPAVRTLQRAMQVSGGAGFAAQGAVQTVTAPTAGGKLAGVAQAAAGAAGVLGGLQGRPQASAAAPAAPVAGVGLSAADAASNAFAAAHDIPLDAATTFGSRTARALQKRVLNSIGGEGIGQRAIGDTQAALTRTGGELAADVHPDTMAPEGAGLGVQDALKGTARTFDTAATQGYDALRAIEADPRHVETVHTAPAGSNAFRSILSKLTTGVESAVSDANPEIQAWANTVGGRGPTMPELMAMRQIEAELDAQPYTPYLLRPTRYGGGLEHVEGTGGAGAAVYHDILQAAPGTADMSRDAVQSAIAKTLDTGEWTNASRGAFTVAQDRLSRSGQLSGPLLDPGAPILGGTARVGLPVSLEVPKQILQPLYDRLRREAELVPLQGGKAQALTALDRLMNGPDIAPVSIVDAALGDLKTMARADRPELRTQGQSLAAAAIKPLSAAVDRAVARAGPDAVSALETGRLATIAKHQALGILEELHENPDTAYRQLTAPKNTGLPLLRRVQEMTPAEIPKIARAKLDEWLDLAGERSGFDHADRLYAEWRKLTPETKQILFSAPGQREALDSFFLLAKRLHENPNPSGTAAVNNVFNVASTVVAWPMAKLLYTPAGVRLLTRLAGMGANLPTLPASGLAPGQLQTMAGWAAVANAAKAAGIPVAVPRAAAAAPTER